jgi:hypothetical protein
MTAVRGQVSDERLHRRINRRVNDGAALSARSHQAGVFELGQVERERRRRQTEPLADFACGQALGPALDQQAENVKSRLLGKRGQRFDGLRILHLSGTMEVFNTTAILSRRVQHPTGQRNATQ